MFVEVKDEYDYNLILHKYSPPHIYLYCGFEYLCKYRFYINQQ